MVCAGGRCRFVNLNVFLLEERHLTILVHDRLMTDWMWKTLAPTQLSTNISTADRSQDEKNCAACATHEQHHRHQLNRPISRVCSCSFIQPSNLNVFHLVLAYRFSFLCASSSLALLIGARAASTRSRLCWFAANSTVRQCAFLNSEEIVM